MLAGSFVLILPFLGFPSNWDTVFLVVVGVLIVGLGIAARRTMHKHHPDTHNHSDGPTVQ